MLSRPAEHIYEFGPFHLNAGEHTLLRDGRPVPLTPKVFDILKLLVENDGHLFGKDELLKAVWPDSFVEEGNLTRNISTLRTALGEKPDEHRYIETVPKRGYRFVAPVRRINGGPAEADLAAMRNDDVAGPAEAAVAESSGHPEPRTINRSYLSVLIAAVVILATVGLLYSAYVRRTPPPHETEVRSLAVLPFKSLSTQADDAYLGLGLADTIITRVRQINGLIVRPTSAVQKYNGLEMNSLEAAKQLQVDSVLEGTIQRTSESLRVNLNLLRTEDGVSLWSGTFDVKPTDVFQMQDNVSQQVAAHLRLKLRTSTQITTPPVKSEEYDYYLRAKFHAGLQNPNDNDAAIELLEKAIAADPGFAAAYAALALEYRNRAFALKPEEKEWEEKAYLNAQKALSLDPNLAEGHIALGLLLWTHSNNFPHEAAVREFRRALELNPNSAEAHHELAHVYNHIGLLEKAETEILRAVEIDPTNTAARLRVGVNLLYRGRYEEALTALAGSEKFNPGTWGYQTAWAFFQLGRKEEAAARINLFLKNYPNDEGGVLTSMQALMAADAGDKRAAEQDIRRAIALGKGFGHFHHAAYAIASSYALMNKREEAIHWLQITANDGFPCYPLFERDPSLDNLRHDENFTTLMARLKEQWQRYQATL